MVGKEYKEYCGDKKSSTRQENMLLEEDWMCSWNWDTELKDQVDCAG